MDLKALAAEEGRWEFLIADASIPVTGGAGSPLNVIAVSDRAPAGRQGVKHEIGMSLFRNGLAAVQDIGGLLIKRGTAMGPLVPLLLLVPVFIGAAWLFKSVAVVAGVPLFSALFALAPLVIVFYYLRQYASFAKHDPDRLQSEKYRYETQRMQMIAAKDLEHPMPAESLPLADPAENPEEHVKSKEAESTKGGERFP